MAGQPILNRRQLLAGALGIGAGVALGGCTRGTQPVGAAAVAAAESARPHSDTVRSYTLTARPVQVDLGGQVVDTWAYGDTIPGTPLRAVAGDRVQVAFTNQLPEETSVHWHGLAIRNDMDGVPGVTTPPVPSGGSFAFDFLVPDPGTHWLHPHTGLQTDRGLYAAFLVDDPSEPGDYDHEWVLVLDDWLDGLGTTPDQAYAALVAAGEQAGHGGMGPMMGGGMGMMSGDGGDVTYPLFLVNGRPGNDPDTLTGRPGQRVRLRIINAAADTVLTVAVAGHRLTVTHTDGYPVTPIDVGALRIGMGERYDATLTLGDGVFPVVAEPIGKPGLARALIRTGNGRTPSADHRPAELAGYPLTVDALTAAPGAALRPRDPDTIGPRKDTVLMPPMGAVSIDLAADNPGRWMVHCHNAYHAAAGMMTRLDYTT